MHAVQETLEEVNHLSDEELIDVVLISWQAVCDENASQKNLVTKEQWTQWERFHEHAVAKMQKAVEGFEGTLTEEGRSAFLSVARDIARAGHKTDVEIIAEAKQAKSQGVLEGTIVADTATPEARKSGWLGALKRLLTRK